MWQSLKQHFRRKRTQSEAASSSLTVGEDSGDLVAPACCSTDEEYESRPKRRSVSIDVAGLRVTTVPSYDRRPSLEQWHEARRARNSLEGQGTTTTDRLTICKAGSTTIVNKTYITIKHLGSGTFGRVMLCFNVYDQRLYAIKICRKSQFASNMSRHNCTSRLRRSMHAVGSYSSLQSPGNSSGLGARSCAGALPSGSAGSSSSASPAAWTSGSNSCAVSCNAGGTNAGGGGITHICATSGSSSFQSAASAAASAAAAASLLGSGAVQQGNFAFPARGATWPAGTATMFQQQPLQAAQHQLQLSGQQPHMLQSPPSPPTPQNLPDIQQQPAFGRCQLPAMHSSRSGPLGVVVAPPPPPPTGVPLLSSGSGGGLGGVGGLLGTECSTGSFTGASVFQEALMRYQTEELVKEIAILKALHHPNIVNLVEVIDDPSTDSLLLVMEYVEGGTLQPRQLSPGRWEPLPEREVWGYVREVLQGLDYLHGHRVVHGDLKPANLLLDNNSNKVKIADFGSSIMAGSDKVFSMRNCPGFSTPAFRSPESLTSGYTPSFEMDMWALGVCIYMWMYGCLPFSGGAAFIIYEKIRQQDVCVPPSAEVSPELRDFIAQLLEKDVLKRLDIQGALQHPWVTLGGSAPLPSSRQAEVPAALSSRGSGCSSAGVGVLGAAGCSGLEATQEEINAAIQHIASGGVSELMDVVFEEIVLQPGAQLVAPGQVADRIYLIGSGELEIVRPCAPGTGAAGGHGLNEPLISGLDLAQLQEAADPDVWDSTTLSDISKEPGGSTDILLLSDVLAPWRGSSNGALQPEGFKLLAVKGPGDSLGVPLLPGSTQNDSCPRSSSGGSGCERHWKVAVLARGRATVFTARLEELAKLVELHPEMEAAVQQIVTQQETDMMVAEAMRQLRLFTASDCHQRQHGCSDMDVTWQPHVQQPLA